LNSFAQGPLTGQFVINKGDIEAKWGGEPILYEFTVKNSGTKPLQILKVIGSCTCQDSDARNIQTIAPGKTGIIRVKVLLRKEILGDEVVNGILDYDKSVIIETNGKKPKYQLYTRARIKIKS
jgi:hypothetical protein